MSSCAVIQTESSPFMTPRRPALWISCSKWVMTYRETLMVRQVEVRDELHLSVQELADSSGYRPQSL